MVKSLINQNPSQIHIMADRDFKDVFDGIEDLSKLFDNLDLDKPAENVIPTEASTFDLLQVQAEFTNHTIGEILRLLAPEDEDSPARNTITNLVEKSNLATRMLQQRHKERGSKAKGSYFDPYRRPICEIPECLKTGATDTISDSALKLITKFEGDTDKEEENLRTFLRGLFDVARTNGLSEKWTTHVLRRKLDGTARILIDSLEAEINQPNRPTLMEIILKLEDRYLARLQPQMANARLAALKKTPEKTYQRLEAEISELVGLAARGQTGNTNSWINTKKIDVFMAAISDHDRNIIFQENQSRAITGLDSLTLSQAVDVLIKTETEKTAFQNDTMQISTNESVFAAKEVQKKPKNNQNTNKKKDELKEELFQLYEKQKQKYSQRNSKNRFYKNARSYPNKNNKQQIRRKFVTPEMVNVNAHSCLKCNSPEHKFQETERCVYGSSNLMTKPCFNCKTGGHHTSLCIKDRGSTLGAPPPHNPPGGANKFSRWTAPQDTSKVLFESKNGEFPSLFPQ